MESQLSHSVTGNALFMYTTADFVDSILVPVVMVGRGFRQFTDVTLPLHCGNRAVLKDLFFEDDVVKATVLNNLFSVNVATHVHIKGIGSCHHSDTSEQTEYMTHCVFNQTKV